MRAKSLKGFPVNFPRAVSTDLGNRCGWDCYLKGSPIEITAA